MIGIEYEKLSEIDFQNANLWEFYFNTDIEIKYYAQSITLPFYGFETEAQIHTHYYTKSLPLDEITVTFLEDTNFRTLKFLRKWQEEIYDFDKKVFKTGDHSKSAIISFQKFKSLLPSGVLQVGSMITTAAVSVLQNIPIAPGLVGVPTAIGVNFTATVEGNRSYELQNLKLKKIENQELNYTSTEPMTISAIFTVDKVNVVNAI